MNISECNEVIILSEYCSLGMIYEYFRTKPKDLGGTIAGTFFLKKKKTNNIAVLSNCNELIDTNTVGVLFVWSQMLMVIPQVFLLFWILVEIFTVIFTLLPKTKGGHRR